MSIIQTISSITDCVLECIRYTSPPEEKSFLRTQIDYLNNKTAPVYIDMRRLQTKKYEIISPAEVIEGTQIYDN